MSLYESMLERFWSDSFPLRHFDLYAMYSRSILPGRNVVPIPKARLSLHPMLPLMGNVLGEIETILGLFYSHGVL